MNFNICKHKCSYLCNHSRLVKHDNEWFLESKSYMDSSNYYGYVYFPVDIDFKELKKCHVYFKDGDTILLNCYEDEDFNINRALRCIHLKNNDSCPFLAEHTMSDLIDEQNIKSWKEKQKIKKKLKKQLVKMKK